VNLAVERLDDGVLRRVSPAAKVEYVFDRRSDAFVLGRASIGPDRTVALLKHPDDGVAGASLVVDRFGGHLGWVAFEAGDLTDLDLQCKCITSAETTTQGGGNGQDG
jgi:hypothetical protein